MFSTKSNIASYCPDCKEIVKKEYAVKANEVRKAKRKTEKLAV